jgi:hypothetical protein
VSESAQPLPWDATTIGHHRHEYSGPERVVVTTFVQEIARTIVSAR